jgi:hypothetical protein
LDAAAGARGGDGAAAFVLPRVRRRACVTAVTEVASVAVCLPSSVTVMTTNCRPGRRHLPGRVR